MQYSLDSNFQGFSGIYPTQVLDKFLVEYWTEFPLAPLTGDLGQSLANATSCIVEAPLGSLSSKDSFSVALPKLYGGDYKQFRQNFDKRVAFAQKLNSSKDTIAYDYYSHVIEMEQINWLSCGQPLIADIPDYAMQDLARMEALHTMQMVIESVYTNLYGSWTPAPPAVNGIMPRSHRAVVGVGNYAYNAAAAFPAQLALAWNGLPRADQIPTVQHLRKCYALLRRPNALGGYVKPYRIQMKNGFLGGRYALLCPRGFYNQIVLDPAWTGAFTYRGGPLLEGQPNAAEGFDWVGHCAGFDIIICDFLDPYQNSFTDGAVPLFWSLCLGAQAFIKGVSPLKGISKDIVNGDDQVVLTSHMIKGVKALVYPTIESIWNKPGFVASPNDYAEQGIVHSFTVQTAA